MWPGTVIDCAHALWGGIDPDTITSAGDDTAVSAEGDYPDRSWQR